MNEKGAYWFEIAEYDLDTAKAMLETRRFLYVGFMCHQVIEKALKGYFAEFTGKNPPYIHNLRVLATDCGLYERLTDNQKDTMEILEPLNIEARYPAYKEQLLRDMTEEKCKEIISRTEELCQWIRGLS